MPILEPFHQVKTTAANLTCADHIDNTYRYIDCYGQGYAKDPYQESGQGFLCSGLLVQDPIIDDALEAKLEQRFLSAFLENIRNAKCLHTAKNFSASKEFAISLGALDSNKELLLKIINQPDSMFAKRLHDLYGALEFYYGHVRSMNSSALKHIRSAWKLQGSCIIFPAQEPVVISGTHALESQGFGHPTMSDQLLWLSSAAKSSLTTSSSPSPPARISLLKILELEILKFLLLKGFTHARRSSGRKTSDECVFLGVYVSCLDNGDGTKSRVMGNISVGADESSNCTFFRDVLLVRQGTYDEAREYVERARSCWATELVALVLEL
ncbi:hypothetical protein Nepgr_004652 [Nepenthes gracilis]|uniref:DUF3741 domain-containing protein n=1 Tax=Nepenthes gracilis TaxID=150966 RepID=A0AAD3S1Q2_NEPGR|nr:hypothetical protein Nepgr_004652 [Nepenthes gracilis]